MANLLGLLRTCADCGKRNAPVKITDEYANTHDWYCKQCYESYGE